MRFVRPFVFVVSILVARSFAYGAIAFDTTANPGGAIIGATDDNVFSGNTTVTPSFSTAAGNRLLLAFLFADTGQAVYPAVVTGAGLTWTLRASTISTVFLNDFGVAIYSAFATSTVSSATVTATWANGATPDARRSSAVYIVALSGTPTSEAACFGNSGGLIDDTGNPHVINATVNVSHTGSWLLGIFAVTSQDSTNLVADAATTAAANKIFATGDSLLMGYFKNNPTVATGNQTFGSSATASFPVTIALEILAAGPAASGTGGMMGFF